MVEHRINELEKIINCHAEFLEEQTHYFEMMRAMLEVALGGTFLNYPQVILHYYLSALSELLVKASGINEASLSLLRQSISLINE
jgi:hypothetical protein